MSSVEGALEIEGSRFHALKQTERPFDDSAIHSALLVVTPEELVSLRELFGRNHIAVRQAPSVDAFRARWGGAMYWSRHVEDGKVYFKQVIRYLPAETSSSRDDRPRKQPLKGHELLFGSLVRGLDTLTRTLVAKGVLSEEERNAVLRDSWRELPLDLQTGADWLLHECADADAML